MADIYDENGNRVGSIDDDGCGAFGAGIAAIIMLTLLLFLARDDILGFISYVETYAFEKRATRPVLDIAYYYYAFVIFIPVLFISKFVAFLASNLSLTPWPNLNLIISYVLPTGFVIGLVSSVCYPLYRWKIARYALAGIVFAPALLALIWITLVAVFSWLFAST